MKKLYALFLAFVSVTAANAQTFTVGTLPSSNYSGGVTGVWDMNNDGRNDIVVMDQSKTLRILYQNANGTFTQVNTATAALGSSQWGMTVADMDNDGYGDVICGGAYDQLHYYNIDQNGVANLNTLDVSIFTQAVTMGDFDNDGWLDFFACHDDGPSKMWRNDGSGNMVYQNSVFQDASGNTLLDYNLYPGNYPGTSDPLMSGNYGNEFTDFDRDGDMDLMVAKCRQASNDPLDVRRTNLMFVNNGSNVYTDEAHDRGLVNLQQTWTATFGDIDNDGDFDCFMTTHSGGIRMYENTGGGYFTDISQAAGLTTSGFFMQGQMADFDNDGYLDVIHAGGSFGYYRNNGNKTFTQQNTAFNNPQTMHGFALGDLNNDGFMDVYANYGNANGYVTPSNTADRLHLATDNGNHWIAFDLEGTVSNKNSVGATVEIHGPFGIQVREVRSGVSYGITNTQMLNFGLGANTTVDYAIIRWPSGITKVVQNPTIDQYHQYFETACTPPTATVTSNGSSVICAGQSVTLTASATGGSFIWNTGETTSSITVSNAGNYSAIAFNPADGCASYSNILTVTVNTDVVAPSITAAGDLEFCEGVGVQLTASEGSSYLWSNGADTQSITALLPGDYTVQVEGACGMATSQAITVSVIDAPAAPVAGNLQIGTSGVTVDLTATGTNLSWYDVATGGSPIGTGTNFTTPVITTSPTSFWVEDVATYGGVEGIGAKDSWTTTSTGGYFTNTPTNYNKFDVFEDIIIDSVLVYANSAGTRTIEVIDANLNVVASGSFSIASGAVYVPVNFFVPAGTGYGMRTTTAAPDFWRDRDVTSATPFAYPFDVNGLASITGTTVTNNNQNQDGNNYYYFFYDWHVHTPEFNCVGPRTEVVVTIVNVSEIESITSLVMYPNPAEADLNIQLNSTEGGMLQINIVDALGRVAQSSQFAVSTGQQNFNMNIDQIAAGMYTVQFVKNGQIASQKLIVR
ncbi:MAG: FG-GAP-like repeat-containing protein [Bacteroidota bacterium]